MEITIRELPIFYESRGEGRPILLLHGQPNDHVIMLNSYEPIFADLEGWRRIYVDIPGMGKTPGADWIHSNDDVVELMGEFLEALAPGEDFVLAGFSYGGYLARAMAYKHAGRCQGLMLMAPTVKPQGERAVPEQNTIVENPELYDDLPEQVRAVFGRAIAVQTEAVVKRSRNEILPAILSADHAYLTRVNEKFRLSYQDDMVDFVFDKPGLFLMGRQDVITGYEDALSLHQKYPRTSIVVLDRCGHGPQLAQQALFESLCAEWLFRVEEMLERKAELSA